MKGPASIQLGSNIRLVAATSRTRPAAVPAMKGLTRLPAVRFPRHVGIDARTTAHVSANFAIRSNFAALIVSVKIIGEILHSGFILLCQIPAALGPMKGPVEYSLGCRYVPKSRPAAGHSGSPTIRKTASRSTAFSARRRAACRARTMGRVFHGPSLPRPAHWTHFLLDWLNRSC